MVEAGAHLLRPTGATGASTAITPADFDGGVAIGEAAAPLGADGVDIAFATGTTAAVVTAQQGLPLGARAGGCATDMLWSTEFPGPNITVAVGLATSRNGFEEACGAIGGAGIGSANVTVIADRRLGRTGLADAGVVAQVTNGTWVGITARGALGFRRRETAGFREAQILGAGVQVVTIDGSKSHAGPVQALVIIGTQVAVITRGSSLNRGRGTGPRSGIAGIDQARTVPGRIAHNSRVGLVHAGQEAAVAHQAFASAIAEVIVCGQAIGIFLTFTEVFAGLANSLFIANSQRGTQVLPTWLRGGIGAEGSGGVDDVLAFSQDALVQSAAVEVVTIHGGRDALSLCRAGTRQRAGVGIFAVRSRGQSKGALPRALITSIRGTDVAIVTEFGVATANAGLRADVIGGADRPIVTRRSGQGQRVKNTGPVVGVALVTGAPIAIITDLLDRAGTATGLALTVSRAKVGVVTDHALVDRGGNALAGIRSAGILLTTPIQRMAQRP